MIEIISLNSDEELLKRENALCQMEKHHLGTTVISRAPQKSVLFDSRVEVLNQQSGLGTPLRPDPPTLRRQQGKKAEQSDEGRELARTLHRRTGLEEWAEPQAESHITLSAFRSVGGGAQ